MLSRVLSEQEAAGARPLAWRSLAGPTRPPSGQISRGEASIEQENRILRERVSRLEADMETTKRQAFESGVRQGDQQARSELGSILERVNASIAELAGMRQELRMQAEKQVVQLSLLIAKRVLHRELSVDANALTALARVVFERLARSESCRVTIHPQFAAAIQGSLSGNQAGRIHIEPDPGCPLGTFVIRSEEGVLDASVEAQLDEINRGLTDRITQLRKS